MQLFLGCPNLWSTERSEVIQTPLKGKQSNIPEKKFTYDWITQNFFTFVNTFSNESLTYMRPALTFLCRIICIPALLLSSAAQSQNVTIIRKWNELLLGAISKDFARPTVHARNLYHSSMMMYDIWAAYDPSKETYFLGKTLHGFSFPFSGVPVSPDMDITAEREKAISYAMYRFISHRFSISPGVAITMNNIQTFMAQRGYPVSITSVDYLNGGAAEFGNFVASQIIAYGMQDGANEQFDYANQFYQPINPPIEPEFPGNPNVLNPNRWQTVSLTVAIDQAGNPLFSDPPFLGAEWGRVKPFALTDSMKTLYVRDGKTYPVYLDPGPPPYIDTLDTVGLTDFYKWNFLMVPRWQAHLDPSDSVMWDISPASIGNIQNYPTQNSDYLTFYDFESGGTVSPGHALNPITGQPYAPQWVPRGDYARVLAEFWADGPASVTPPGHWFEILHTISDHPLFERKWMGQGPVLDPLEYDAKAHFTLGGAMHDAAITAWGIKGWYDYARPITAVRFMAEKGQCSDPNLPNFHPAGLPLIPGFTEIVQPGDSLAGVNNQHVGKVKMYTWRGPDYINDPETDMAGVGWILAENWWSYQRPTFVTPPFGGYISGHSTYSRTAAELLTLMTGSPYFPGGISNFVADQNEFLVFEEGPSVPVVLQWATFRDASDQCSLSRIWGGIHPPVDDIPGRHIGMILGPLAFQHADSLIQVKRPAVSQITATPAILNIQSAGTFLFMDLIFDEPMNTSVNPTIQFIQNSPVPATLGFISTVWTNNSTYRLIYSVNNAGQSPESITMKVFGGVSAAGITQNPQMFLNPFRLDMQRPSANMVSPSGITLNDSHCGIPLFLNIYLSEACDTTTLPECSFAAGGPALQWMADSCRWVSPTQFQLAYLLNDTDSLIGTVDLQITGNLFDTAGNEALPQTLTAVLTVDTRNPQLTSYLLNKNRLNLSDLGNQAFWAELHFSASMDTNTSPRLWFSLPDPSLSALQVNPQHTFWINDTSCRITYNFLNTGEEFHEVEVGLNLLSGLNGNPPEPGLLPDLIYIDPVRPTVQTLTPQGPYMADEHSGTNRFYYWTEFSEKMDISVKPILQIMGSAGAIPSIQYDFTNSQWEGEQTFKAAFFIQDLGEEITDLTVKVSFAKDYAGNTQLPSEWSDLVQLDTKNPTCVSLTANTYQINEQTGTLRIFSIFDEPMDTVSAPTYTFLSAAELNGILITDMAQTLWINPYTHQASFQIGWGILQTTAGISLQAHDRAGNLNADFTTEDIFEIHLQGLTVSATDPSAPVVCFPNPAYSGGMLMFSEPLHGPFSLFNSLGQEFYIDEKGLTSSLQLPQLSEGLYYLRFNGHSETVPVKIVIVKH